MLAICYDPQEVLVSLGNYQQLLHDVVPASPLGIRVGEAALTLKDAAAAPVRDELLDVKLICEVGFVVVTEPAVSDLPLGVGIHDDTLVVQDRNILYISPSYENSDSVGSTFFERDELFIRLQPQFRIWLFFVFF